MALLYTCSVNCTASHFKRGGLPLLANTQLRLLSTDRFVPFYAATCNCVVTSVCVFTFWCTKLQLQETLHKCCLSWTKLMFPLTLTPEEGKANLRELEQLTVSVLFCLFICLL